MEKIIKEKQPFQRIEVGRLYELNPVDPQLESAWFQPLSLPLDPL
jgi:hypothetical protein